MSEEWLAAESFERAHQIISAINTLAVHAKLQAAGLDDNTTEEELTAARQTLNSFLLRLETIVGQMEKDEEAPVPGVDPRLNSLARQFVFARNQWPRSILYDETIGRLREIALTEQPSNLPHFIECLRALRALVEQHAHADVVGILGEM